MSRLLPAHAFVVLCALVTNVSALAGTTRGQPAESVEALHKPFDEILDLYVRDGYVYYRALTLDRSKLDHYVASLDGPAATTYSRWSRDQRAAFWLNTYNAFVLETVVNHYPIRGRSPAFPPNSIRQIPGAFDRLPHRAAGRTLTLDELEKTVLSEFRDPRLYMALGRGAAGSGRLRSEAYAADRLETQLQQVAAEFATKPEYVRIDRLGQRVTASPLFSWREADFVAAYGAASARFGSRSPIERALLAFVEPYLLPGETEFLQKNEFRVIFHEFDWRLNDLTGGRR